MTEASSCVRQDILAVMNTAVYFMKFHQSMANLYQPEDPRRCPLARRLASSRRGRASSGRRPGSGGRRAGARKSDFLKVREKCVVRTMSCQNARKLRCISKKTWCHVGPKYVHVHLETVSNVCLGRKLEKGFFRSSSACIFVGSKS